MSGVVLDTPVYVRATRLGTPALLDSRRYAEPVYYSAVVAEELYVGARNQAERRQWDRLWRAFQQMRRLVVPAGTDWREAGTVLSQVGQQFGYEQVGRGRLTNDALIGVSAYRLGLTIVTTNRRDFELLARYRPFRLLVLDEAELNTPD